MLVGLMVSDGALWHFSENMCPLVDECMHACLRKKNIGLRSSILCLTGLQSHTITCNNDI